MDTGRTGAGAATAKDAKHESEPEPEAAAAASVVEPKDESVVVSLVALLAGCPQLAPLEDAQREAVARSLAGPLDLSKDDQVLGAGALADALFFVESGEVAEGDRVYRAGHSFGELSLLRGLPASAPVIALSASRLWRLAKPDFDDLLGPSLNERNESRCRLLGKTGVLSTLSDAEIYRLAHRAEESHVLAEGEPVMVLRQGESSSSLLVVVAGSVESWQVDAEGSEVLTATLGDGDFAEETALLGERPAAATLRVPGEARLLRLSREALQREVGPLEALLKRNMEVYSRYIGESMEGQPLYG